ncbi:MAG TPA: S41 family peptidase [Thermoanaerobaculia bacterium]|nr:S41 family peptidase [Thermoanaerobaculia bacterium]
MIRLPGVVFATLGLVLGSSSAAAAPDGPPPLTAAAREAIVEDIAAALEAVYVFPESATAMQAHLRQQLSSGAYDAVTTLPAFAERLTEDLQEVSRDKHLRVHPTPPLPAGATEGPSEEERRARFAAALRRDNYCFRRLEQLEGNVGYLRLDCFAPADLGGATATAAMGFLAGSDALIFDLRNNGGGSPSMIQLLTSYLLPGEPTHLNSFYIRREDTTQQFWTQAWVPGPRLAEVPMFVLTSSRTFSAAEEFTYNLKSLERATIVGETTGGGAHPVSEHRVEGYDLAVALPFGRAINPVTRTNWEGTGVDPDVPVAADQALDVAHARALTLVAERTDDPEVAAHVGFIARSLADRARAIELSPEQLAAYTGSYGPRVVTLDGGTLYYRRGEGRERPLVPVGEDQFLLGEMNDFRLRFERGPGGAVVRLVGIYPDGREEPNERSGG